MLNSTQNSTSHKATSLWLLLLFLAPVIAAMLVYQLDSFHPSALPIHELAPHPLVAPKTNNHMLDGAELVGSGILVGPEDIAYDANNEVIYTGCADGWIKIVSLNDSTVKNFINTGGRPLGVALACDGRVIVADAYKGLISINEDGKIELLANEANGQKFKLTDALDIAKDGMIYFSDASYKYNLSQNMLDILQGIPHGRLLSFNPRTKETKVLLDKLYFANGVALSPSQDFVVVCETVMKRCKRYYIQGEKAGLVDIFVDHLPGMPDNILYDGHGHYWIAIATESTYFWNMALTYPFIRKILAILERYNKEEPHMAKNGGVFVVDLEGKPVAHYYDPKLSLVSSGIQIGSHLYCGNVYLPYIIRLDLDQHPAVHNV